MVVEGRGLKGRGRRKESESESGIRNTLGMLNTGSCQKVCKSHCNSSAIQGQPQITYIIKVNEPHNNEKTKLTY